MAEDPKSRMNLKVSSSESCLRISRRNSNDVFRRVASLLDIFCDFFLCMYVLQGSLGLLWRKARLADDRLDIFIQGSVGKADAMVITL